MRGTWVQAGAFAIATTLGAALAVAYTNLAMHAATEIPAGPVAGWHSSSGHAAIDVPSAPVVPAAAQQPVTVPPAPVATTQPQPRPSIPPTVAATPISGPSARGPAALSLLHFPVVQLGFQIVFHGPRNGYLGMTYCDTRVVNIYVRPEQSVAQVAYITAWETAHAVDCNHPERRAQWAALRGFGIGGYWFPTCECSEDSYGSGDFAAVFADWQVGPEYSWRSRLAPPPTTQQLQLLLPYLQA